MTRTVRQSNAPPDRPEEARLRPFSDFAGQPNLVLLGDPGAGKSHLFREEAAAEAAKLVTARAFLVTPAAMLSGQALFIDGLDEKRAGRGDRNTFDALVEKLFAVNPAKVRISCRAADWLGESDLAAFRPYFEQTGTPPVLLLQNLSLEEQRTVLAGQNAQPGDADAFLADAQARGLSDFLENPQNLIMLWRVVQAGSWPATRRELFELSTGLLLQEFDPDRARAGSGVYSAAELRPVAGAICAARLISDVEAISLTDQEGTLEIPGYRSLTFLEPAKIQAALGRRVFVAASGQETVDYAHRTTAEYLAAAFLAEQVRGGLPFGRVTALIGVDGHPAPELRGLHAWLAVHLREHADELIDTDPYGVLTYGDAASLSPSSCAALVRALGQLSKSNPWFRSGNWQAPSVGALSRRDMIVEFRAVLNDPDAGFGIRSVVVDALLLGTQLPEMRPDLATILVREASSYLERAHALLALFRLGEEGKTLVIAAFQAGLGRSLNGLRLRAEIIQQLYGQPFGPSDVTALVNDMLQADEGSTTGILWGLADNVPLADLPSVLDGIYAPPRDDGGYDRRGYEVGSFFARVLVRVWCGPEPFDAGRALNWLHKRLAFRGVDSQSRARDMRAAMGETPDKVRAVADHFFDTFIPGDESWLALSHFRQATLHQLSNDALLDLVVRHLAASDDGSDKQIFLYEAALGLCYHAERSRGEAAFEALLALADSKPFLQPVRESSVLSRLPAGYFRGRSEPVAEEEDSRERQRAEFAQDVEVIRSGAHFGWVAHLSKIYFALYDDVDQDQAPRGRLAAWLGEENADTALEGLRAALSRNDLPSLADVIAITAEHQHYDWWYGLVAGLNERWALGEGFGNLSDDFLKALLAFDLANPISTERDGKITWLVHPWKEVLLEQRPELVRDAFLAVTRLRLSARDDQGLHGLNDLMTGAAFEPFRRDIALELLRDFPNANPFRLADMLDAVAQLTDAHAGFPALADSVISGAVVVDGPQRDLWLATAYLLSPARYEREVETSARARPNLVFALRDRSGFASQAQPEETTLSLPQLEFIARLTGALFRDVSHPSGGWSGNINAWDAAEYCRGLFSKISAIPSEAATNVLERLEADPELASYRPHILHALANQRQLRRDTEYDRPNWPQTVAALSNGAPATVADLHALVVAHLRDLKKRIERENTDIFKQFWNVDQWARPTNPRPEEACRDDLLTLMRPALQALDIAAEPEGHMAGDKRADIAVSIATHKILCELKRDSHDELWTAVTGQLDRFYTPDPGARGFGVYCAFWFGDKRTGTIPVPPNGLSRPNSAEELEQMLKDLLPANAKNRIAIIVIDVSGQI